MRSGSDGTEKTTPEASEKITFKTGSSTYSFTQEWIEKPALKDILVGLIADDISKQDKNEIKQEKRCGRKGHSA